MRNENSGLHAGHRKRVKDRYLKEGLASFEPHQILEMLLFFGIPQKDTNELAHRLIQTFGGLPGVLKADYDNLLTVAGMTPNAAMLTNFIGQLIREYYRRCQTGDIILDTLEKIGSYVLPYFFGERNEKVLLVSLDAKCKVLYTDFVGEGSINATEIQVRRIMEQALRSYAHAVVIAHNHPSGFALPSREDQATTRLLAESLAVADVRLLDHIIVADDDYVSMNSTATLKHLFRIP